MRAHALEKGFTLNEYTIRPLGVTGESQPNVLTWTPCTLTSYRQAQTDDLCCHLFASAGVVCVSGVGMAGEPMLVDSERDIFEYIEYRYREPKDRSEWSKVLLMFTRECVQISMLVCHSCRRHSTFSIEQKNESESQLLFFLMLRIELFLFFTFCFNYLWPFKMITFKSCITKIYFTCILIFDVPERDIF